MSRLLLGVMGHVDHGKTALVHALTGTDTDRLPEEKRRGVSIVLGFAHADIDGVAVDFIDMPGHERFVRTLVSGATGVSAALLVVAANEGIKPQTVEHLQIASLLGLKRVLVVVSKTDLVSPEQARTVAHEVAALVAHNGIDGRTPKPAFVQVSVRDGAGLDTLRAAIAKLARDTQPPEDDGFPYLPIDRAFSLTGHGTVVTGTLQRGALSADPPLASAPAGVGVRVRGLQVHGAAVQSAEPGQRVAVNLRGVEPHDIGPGTALTLAGLLTPSSWLDARLTSTAEAAPLKTGARLSLLFATVEVQARLRLLDREVLAPGTSALAQLHCALPVAAPARTRLILRIPSPASTVAGGVVLDPVAVRRRRHDPKVLARLQALATLDPAAVLADTLHQAAMAGVGVDRLAQLAGWSRERAAKAAQALGAVSLGGDLWVTSTAFEAARRGVLDLLTEQIAVQPNGVALRRLAALAPAISTAVLAAAVSSLVAAGRLRQDGGLVRLAPRPSDEAERGRQGALAAAKLADVLRQGGLTPPDLDAMAPSPQARRALDALVREGVAVRTFDRVQKREILFHREAVDQARLRLAPRLAPPGLLVKEAGALLGVSRKYSVPLLEYLDTVRFTRRVGDRRVLGPTGQV